MSDDRVRTSVRVPGRIESVRPAAAFIVGAARSVGVPAAADRLFELAIVEAITNAIQHNARTGDAHIECEFELDGNRAIVRVLDEAARAPLAVTIPAGPVPWSNPGEPLWETIPESGYGLHLMRSVFPEIRPATRDGLHGIEMVLTV